MVAQWTVLGFVFTYSKLHLNLCDYSYNASRWYVLNIMWKEGKDSSS